MTYLVTTISKKASACLPAEGHVCTDIRAQTVMCVSRRRAIQKAEHPCAPPAVLYHEHDESALDPNEKIALLRNPVTLDDVQLRCLNLRGGVLEGQPTCIMLLDFYRSGHRVTHFYAR